MSGAKFGTNGHIKLRRTNPYGIKGNKEEEDKTAPPAPLPYVFLCLEFLF